MKPGERIRLITEAAAVLLARPWAEAQLTLDQFGFETYEGHNSFDFDEHGYFIAQIKDGADDRILALHEYLQGEDAAPVHRSVDSPWGSQPLRVFTSHIHEQRVFLGMVKGVLGRSFGTDAFVAHDDIQPSKQWREVIKAALNTCHGFVAFLHPGFHDSQWCDQEVGWALGRNIPVLAVRTQDTERRDGFLEEHQDITLPAQGVSEFVVARQILEVFAADVRTKEPARAALAEAFVNSFSYDSTRRWYERLAAQDTLEPDLLRRLEYAVQTNNQVYNAFGSPPDQRPMPELVAELVAKHEPRIIAYDDEPF